MHQTDESMGGAPERDLFRRLIDQQLSPEEFAEFEQRLLLDRELRARYVQYMDLEASLYDELLALPAAVEQTCNPNVLQSAGSRPVRLVGWSVFTGAAAAVVAFVAYCYWPAAPSGSGFVEIPLQGVETAAIVTHAEGLGAQRVGAEIKPGMRLKPGSLTLKQGQVQVEFLGGAKLLVQAPCELHILSPKSATLVSGKAATRVLEWGRGFVLNTPEAVMVDLGTEFAVGVDQQHGSEVQVVRGEVEVSVLGDDGSTLTSEIVEEANGLRIRPGATSFEPDPGVKKAPLRVFDDPPRPLSVPDSYVRTVLQAKPTIYWRFQSQEDGLIRNDVGPQFAARLRDENEGSAALRIADGQLHFAEAHGPRYVTAAEVLPTLNAESFSVEFWVSPAMLHWATLVAITPEGDDESKTHLNVIELAHQTPLVHEAGAFRFMHRHPPDGTGGMNIFSSTGCTPGRWHHLVAVKTPRELKLYLNGQLTRSLSGEMGSDEDPYQLHLGELRISSRDRQFVGSIDEFALYLHALSDTEIERHYRLLAVGGAE
ncbi:MAG: FecR domain-containing protein [Planctomycetes bacterium]|nr:FecR domain-containing protein [Planctomycetota bacterium]